MLLCGSCGQLNSLPAWLLSTGWHAGCVLTGPLHCAPQLDTGHDVPAIAGALASLAAGRVGVLTFMYCGEGLWGGGHLEDVVSRLDELSYACYFSGGCDGGTAGGMVEQSSLRAASLGH